MDFQYIYDKIFTTWTYVRIALMNTCTIGKFDFLEENSSIICIYWLWFLLGQRKYKYVKKMQKGVYIIFNKNTLNC